MDDTAARRAVTPMRVLFEKHAATVVIFGNYAPAVRIRISGWHEQGFGWLERQQPPLFNEADDVRFGGNRPCAATRARVAALVLRMNAQTGRGHARAIMTAPPPNAKRAFRI
jgi:hypothetical protein